MNKEQIAYEKWWQNPSSELAGHRATAWNSWQARAALDKQDSLEIVKELDKALIMGSDVGALAMIPMDLLTKIRKHLMGE